MKFALKHFVIAVTGDFGAARSHDKIKQWVQHNGGNFATEMTARVTHLVCSKDHFKKKVAIGKNYCGRLYLNPSNMDHYIGHSFLECLFADIVYYSQASTEAQDGQHCLLRLA